MWRGVRPPINQDDLASGIRRQLDVARPSAACCNDNTELGVGRGQDLWLHTGEGDVGELGPVLQQVDAFEDNNGAHLAAIRGHGLDCAGNLVRPGLFAAHRLAIVELNLHRSDLVGQHVFERRVNDHLTRCRGHQLGLHLPKADLGNRLPGSKQRETLNRHKRAAVAVVGFHADNARVRPALDEAHRDTRVAGDDNVPLEAVSGTRERAHFHRRVRSLQHKGINASQLHSINTVCPAEEARALDYELGAGLARVGCHCLDLAFRDVRERARARRDRTAVRGDDNVALFVGAEFLCLHHYQVTVRHIHELGWLADQRHTGHHLASSAQACSEDGDDRVDAA